MRERTFEEKLAEREQAYAAQIANEKHKAREDARERAEVEPHAITGAMQPPPLRPKEYAENLAEKNSGIKSSSPPSKTRAQRGLPPNQSGGSMTDLSNSSPVPSVMTHCAGGFCYDNAGGVYPQHGNGRTMTGPNGNTCIRTGTMINC